MQMEFVSPTGEVVGAITWPAERVTRKALKHQARTALAGFYLGNGRSFWPRKANVPQQVRIVDAGGKVIVAYSARDLATDTRRSLCEAAHG